jgi:hypothetical protein
LKRARSVLLLAVGWALAGCQRDEQPERTTFYDRKIGPVLHASCSISPTRSSCHVSDGQGNAFGNLSTESFETLNLRRDLLVDYGPYGVPGLLLKVVPPYRLSLSRWDATPPVLITTDIIHAGSSQIDFTSAAYTTLAGWIENGGAVNNAAVAEPQRALDRCTDEPGRDPTFDGTVDPASPDYDTFRGLVAPVVGARCAAGNCHGSPANILHLTCGETPDGQRWNYHALRDYVAVNTNSSEILRRALARDAGGTYHEGGTVFPNRDDPGYQALEAWATEKGGPTSVPSDPGFLFFADRVQPMLVKRGCMMLGCHSSAMFHDYRLRGGAGGHFGLPATKRNYELSLEQLALESPDPNASRLIKKNLAPAAGGIRHRGGNLFGEGELRDPCDLAAAQTGPLDEQRPYCVVRAWFELERSARMADLAPLSGIVYVRRAAAADPDTPQDFGTYRPGADVVLAGLTAGVDGSLTVGTSQSLLARCGLDPTTTDARRPAVSWDGARIAFSARSGADQPFRVYVVTGSTCAADAAIDAVPVDDSGAPVMANGELIHNFDPAFAPDGRIVFTSTRGNVMNTAAIGYSGPRRTPADPSKLNANLYVREGDDRIRQLTFLNNQELYPAFMRDGRLIFSAEKRAPDFYQLAGRRMNLDGGDYHPLFGQRSSIDFTQLTDVVELADKNLAMILSDKGAERGAGALAIVNRSIGIDQPSTNPADYLVDPDAITAQNPDFFQHSLEIIDRAATGKLSGTEGAYRNPSPLPDGRLLVSYAPTTTALDAFSGKFEIVVMNPQTEARTTLISDPTDDCLWPAAVYAKQNHGVFGSRFDEANAATRVGTGSTAKVTVLDVGVLQSLLFQNTRSGRPIPNRPALAVWESLPPEQGVTDYASGGSYVTSDRYGQLYARRHFLGNVTVHDDRSAKMVIPGGLPIVLQGHVALAGDSAPTTHSQREEMQFYPGEDSRQSFRQKQFDGLCGGCHGSVSGVEMDIAIEPDILTSASQVTARDAKPTDLSGVARVGAGTPPPFP